MQLGDVAELEAEGELAAEVAASMLQACKCLILFAFVAASADFDGGVAGIGADVDGGDFDLDQARVVELEPNDFTELFANRFAYPEHAPLVHIICGP